MGLFLVIPAGMPGGLEGHRRERGHELGAGVLNLGFLFGGSGEKIHSVYLILIRINGSKQQRKNLI